MANKHTPGPWEMKIENDGNGGQYFVIYGPTPRELSDRGVYSVADTLNRHHCVEPREDEDNALLMAAAPEMEELLKAAYVAVVPGCDLERRIKALFQKIGVMR